MTLTTLDIHDALAEAKNSDEIYALILEHYEDAKGFNRCSREYNTCAALIGRVVMDAIRSYEPVKEMSKAEMDEDAAADAADDKYTLEQES